MGYKHSPHERSYKAHKKHKRVARHVTKRKPTSDVFFATREDYLESLSDRELLRMQEQLELSDTEESAERADEIEAVLSKRHPERTDKGD